MPVRALRLVTAAVAILGLAAEVLNALAPGDLTASLRSFLSLSYEANLPTWYSSALLLGCAVMLALISADTRRAAGRDALQWMILAAVFTYMSLDETAEIHEHFGSHAGGHGIFFFDWILVGGAIALAVGIAFLPFLFRLPPATRWRFVLAGVLYLGGAIVLEMPLGWWAERHGDEGLVYACIDWVEEAMELLGATLFLTSLVAYRRERPRT